MRIAITNDMAMAVEALKRVVLSDPLHQIAWIAENGQQAVNLSKKDPPDLILMDMIMPGMDGVEATRLIMTQSPCAILVVTTSVDGLSGKVFDAMGAGAVDAVNTPILLSFGDPGQGSSGAEDLLKKITNIGKLIESAIKTPIVNIKSKPVKTKLNSSLLVLGASTGGPNALALILADLPKNFKVPIVIVQHVDVQFVEGFKQWLGEQIVLPVELIHDGDVLKPGCVQLADSGRHLIINQEGRLLYQDEPNSSLHKPSINVLFDSVATNWNGRALGVLLTGMGKDGATGLLAMRQHGQNTMTQDEKSCAVFGMPKAAIELQAVEVVKPLIKIATEICVFCGIDNHSQVISNG